MSKRQERKPQVEVVETRHGLVVIAPALQGDGEVLIYNAPEDEVLSLVAARYFSFEGDDGVSKVRKLFLSSPGRFVTVGNGKLLEFYKTSWDALRVIPLADVEDGRLRIGDSVVTFSDLKLIFTWLVEDYKKIRELSHKLERLKKEAEEGQRG